MNRHSGVDFQFHNREIERRAFVEVANSVKETSLEMILFSAADSYGSTCFLDHVKRDKEFPFKKIFLDCQDKSLDSFLRNTIFELCEYDEEFNDKIQEKINALDKPTILKKTENTILSGIPYVGRPIMEARSKPKNSVAAGYRIQTSPNEILSLVSAEIENDTICLLLDNFDELDKNQLKFIADLKFYMTGKSIVIVACQNTLNSNNRVNATLANVGFRIHQRCFNSLSEDDLKEIAKDRNILLEKAELRLLGKGNIYDFLEYLHKKAGNIEERISLDTLSPLCEYILHLMSIFGSVISEALLKECILHSKVIYFSNISELDSAISTLVNRYIISKWSFSNITYLKIKPNFNNNFHIKISLSDRIVHSNDIYEVVKKRLKHLDQYSLRLTDYLFAFNLSLRIAPDESKIWAKTLLATSLKTTGGFNLLEYLKQYIEPNSNYETYLICLAASMQNKDYDYFNELYESADISYQLNTESLIFKAICDNRLRKYNESEKWFDICMKGNKNRDEILLRFCFKLINLFHTGNIEIANRIFSKHKGRLKNARFSRYFLRIGAGMVSPKEGIAILREILPEFSKDKDEFGLYTSIANLGALYCRSGELQKGQQILKTAFNKLISFGPDHITHCALSYGTALLLSGEFENAKIVLSRIVTEPEDEHYALAAKMLIADAELRLGNESYALENMRLLTDRVANTPTQNIKSRFFINYGLALVVSNKFDNETENLVSLAQKFKPKATVSEWDYAYSVLNEALISKTSITKQKYNECYLTGYFEYWWFNPLPMIMK